MEITSFIKLLKNKKKTIYSIIFFFVVIGLIITLARPLQYEAQTKLLIVQKLGAKESFDSYTVAKNNEFLGNLFSRVSLTESFLNQVLASDSRIDNSYFTDNQEKRMRLWSQSVSIQTVNDSGIVIVSVYNPDRAQAQYVANGVNEVLINKHQVYHGNSNVEIKIVDGPVTSTWPNKPNIFVNFFLSLVLGLFFSISYVYLFPEARYDIQLWPNRKPVIKKSENIVTPVYPVIKPDIDKQADYVLRNKENNVPERLPTEEAADDTTPSGNMENLLKS